MPCSCNETVCMHCLTCSLLVVRGRKLWKNRSDWHPHCTLVQEWAWELSKSIDLADLPFCKSGYCMMRDSMVLSWQSMACGISWFLAFITFCPDSNVHQEPRTSNVPCFQEFCQARILWCKWWSCKHVAKCLLSPHEWNAAFCSLYTPWNDVESLPRKSTTKEQVVATGQMVIVLLVERSRMVRVKATAVAAACLMLHQDISSRR